MIVQSTIPPNIFTRIAFTCETQNSSEKRVVNTAVSGTSKAVHEMLQK